jgi:VWFA-related protein
MAASRHALAPAFLTIALAVPASGQAPVAQPPVFGTDVRVVAVPVFVTDKAGGAVGGLTAADFELEDQGKKVPLVAFLEVDAAADTPAGAEAGPLVQASARRQFLFLFDLTFSTPTGVMRARDAALQIVRESLLPSDLAAVATFGQRGIQILVTFTPDHSQLERAIATLGLTETQPPPRDMLSIAYDLGLPRWGPGIGPPPAEDADRIESHLMSMSRQMARADQAVYKQHVDGFLDGLEQLVRTLDAVQGRKQVVLLSAGFDSSVIAGATGQESQEASEAVVAGRVWEVQSDRYFGDSRARDALDSVFKTVAATDTVFHSVDVTGMSARGGVADALPQPIGRGRDTLAQFAANTGGRFVADANDLEAALQSLLDSSRRYYVLAFEPLDAKGKPDKLRRLKVRVRGDGLQVSHRRGYALADPKRQASPAAAALQAGEAIAKGLTGGELALRAMAVPYRNTRGALALPVILEIDGRRLSESKAKELGLEVFGYAFDGEGHILDNMTLSPTLDLAAVRPALEAKGLQVITSFLVPEGPVDLRFLVREKASKRTGSLRLRLEVPAFDGDETVLSPPLLIDDPRARLVVPAPSRGLPKLEIPFRMGERAFTADPLPTLVNGSTREMCLMAWSGAGGATDDTIEVRLVDASGGEHALALAGDPRVFADADGTTRYLLSLVPKGVPKGRYVLRLGFAGSGSPSSELAVRVE